MHTSGARFLSRRPKWLTALGNILPEICGRYAAWAAMHPWRAMAVGAVWMVMLVALLVARISSGGLRVETGLASLFLTEDQNRENLQNDQRSHVLSPDLPMIVAVQGPVTEPEGVRFIAALQSALATIPGVAGVRSAEMARVPTEQVGRLEFRPLFEVYPGMAAATYSSADIWAVIGAVNPRKSGAQRAA